MAESIHSVEPDWRELAADAAAPPFLGPEWIRAWVDAFGGGDLRLHTVRRDGRLVAVAPLLRHDHHDLVSPANWHTPLWAPLALDDAAARALARSVHTDRPRRLELRCLDPDLPSTRSFLRELRSLGYRALPERHDRLSPTARLEGDWEAYSQRLGRRRRADIRRGESRLAELGTVSIELHRAVADLDTKLREGLEIESSGWKGRSHSAIASSAETEAFYARVARDAAEKGSLLLVFIRLDDRPIAFSFNLQEHGTVYGLKMGYDESFRTYGPGILMMKAVVSAALDGGARAFDLGGNLETDGFKREWSDGARHVVTSTWVAPGLRGAIEHRAVVLADAARGVVRSLLDDDRREKLRALRSRLTARFGRR